MFGGGKIAGGTLLFERTKRTSAVRFNGAHRIKMRDARTIRGNENWHDLSEDR